MDLLSAHEIFMTSSSFAVSTDFYMRFWGNRTRRYLAVAKYLTIWPSGPVC